VDAVSVTTMDPLQDGISALTLVESMGDDQRIVAAARVSTGLDLTEMDAARDAKLIRYLLRHGHWSCFEHCYLTVRVVAPLPIVRQWQRHTSWRFNEVSRRYTSENVRIYRPRPPFVCEQAPGNKQASGEMVDGGKYWQARHLMDDAIARALLAYDDLLELGIARETARLVLPQAMYSAMYATASLRSALHFIGLRADEAAQGEMQVYARALGELVAARWPVTWAAWSELRGQGT
jgi:thymidylate synthase (FAD)